MVLSVTKALEHQIVGWLLNSKLKWMRKEVIMSDLRYSVGTCLDGWRNSTTLFESRLRYQPGTSVIQIAGISFVPAYLVMWAFRHSKVLHRVYWNALVQSFMLQYFRLGLVRNRRVMLFDVAAAWWMKIFSWAYMYMHHMQEGWKPYLSTMLYS
jgi:hypothetical protein